MKTQVFKTILLAITLIVLLAVGATAKVITVDNKPGAVAEYSNLQKAIDAASSGDTLYVAGSSTSYGSATTTKNLAIFGESFYNTPNLRRTEMTIFLGKVTVNDVTSHPTSLYFSGLYIDLKIGKDIDGFSVTFDNCDMSYGYSNVSDVSNTYTLNINNSVVRNLLGSGSKNNSYSVTNSILKYTDVNEVGSTSTFKNCIFYTGSIYAEYSTIENCIFYKCQKSISYSKIRNNIVYHPLSTDANQSKFLSSTNTIDGNIDGQNPLFTKVDDNVYNCDFRLQATSPAKDKGLDGKDLGLYGGDSPFPIGENSIPFILSSVPSNLPLITELSIKKIRVPKGGKLEVDIKAKN